MIVVGLATTTKNIRLWEEYTKMGNNVIKCQRSGCDGTIIDGFCEDCGKPALGQASVVVNGVVAAKPAQGGTTNGRANTSTTSTTSTTGTARTTSKRHTSRSSSRGSSKRRQSLGGGLVSLPPQANQDPLLSVKANPEVPESKRYCPSCNGKVNRSTGFCSNCGSEYNFEPQLKAGDIVNSKFEIKGPIALGGLGWIYLAWDKKLSRWVVLKGLLNTKDEASAAAAIAELQFLAAVKHPKIVGVYDFVTQGSESFIVMEYVGGIEIKELCKENDTVTVKKDGVVIKHGVIRKTLSSDERKLIITVDKKGLLTVEEAISYILGILPAFSYMHEKGLVYCDFKPENFMLEGDDVKLVDMGGVRVIGDMDGDIYGTKGYMAPEANDDPYAASDLYTIGRALATLIMDFKFQSTYENSLPSPQDQPVLAQNESLYRFLLRSTHQDPDQRFQTADEMFDQLYGVLREIVALKGDPKPVESTVFSSDNLIDSEDVKGTESVIVNLLPTLKIDAKDPAANDLLRLATIIDPEKRILMLEQIVAKFRTKTVDSVEARLRLAEALIVVERYDEANKLLNKLEVEDQFDWRVHWFRGKSHLTQGDGKSARNAFGKVYFEMPGEIAPKLAIAYAAEESGNKDEAISFYDRVSRVDPNYTTACFGLARCLKAKGDVAKAAAALTRVPPTHSLYTQSRIKLANVLINDETKITDQILDQTAQIIETITIDNGVVHQLMAKLLVSAGKLVNNGSIKEDKNHKLLGHSMTISGLRSGAESEYRKASRYSTNVSEKISWIDKANEIRPYSIF